MTIKTSITAVAIATILFTACQKETTQTTTTTTPTTSDPVCAESKGVADGTIIPGQYIVSYDTSAATSSVASRPVAMARLNVNVLQRNGIDTLSLRQSFGGRPGGFVAHLTADEVVKLRKDKSISIVEPDRMIALSTCFHVVQPSLITWNIKRTGYGDGTGKTAWIIDTGIDFTHPDLNVDQARSKSFVSGVTSANDDNGHGTHVAGIIGAKNNSIGTLGVASGATLVALKVLSGDGKGPVSAIIQALAYVSANAKAGDVVNMSLGEDGSSAVLNQQVQATAAKGIFIAIAAGNDAKAADAYSPANANGKNIYTVSAIDSLDNFASFSNYGNDVVDYAEPGVDIVSCWSQGRYAIASGTSMAAPHLAGLLLLNGGAITTSGKAKNDPDGVADAIGHR